jgi:N-acetylneuraminate synthase
MEINGRQYKPFSPYLIAEIGVNHEGNFKLAKRLIEEAAEAGASAVKFQSYEAKKLAAKNSSQAYWDTSQESEESQYELFSRYSPFSHATYEKLADIAKSNDVDFLSTPFDLEIAEVLDPLVPAFKIASADLTNIPLIEKVMSFEKPIIFSVGASSADEIQSLANRVRGHGSHLAFLHCVLNYPTHPVDANLLAMRNLTHLVGDSIWVGYSDHVPPLQSGRMPQLEIAFLFGAVVIEKHFTLDKSLEGNDHYHAMDKRDLAMFTGWMRDTREYIGNGEIDLKIQEPARLNARRRIFVSVDLGPGDLLTEENLIPLRSNIGIPIDNWAEVLGKRVRMRVQAGEALLNNHLEVSGDN